MKADVQKLTVEMLDMRTACLHIEVAAATLEKLPATTTPLAIEIKRKTKKRSLDANSYCWVLCEAIAKVTQQTKEDVYRAAVRAVGVWDIVYVIPKAVDRYLEVWQAKGLGYIAEPLSSTLNGLAAVQTFYGSSLYDTAQMSRLIEWLVDEAEPLGIDTRTPEERMRMMEDWDLEQSKTHA